MTIGFYNNSTNRSKAIPLEPFINTVEFFMKQGQKICLKTINEEERENVQLINGKSSENRYNKTTWTLL
jgi:hypothetical protein